MPAFKSHKTATSDKAWDGPANKARVRSGGNRAYYGRIFAWYDPEGDEGVKETYRFIHHEVAADGTPGPANLTACSTGIGILNGGRGGTTIPEADRTGVHAHLAKHLKDAGKEVPPLARMEEWPHLVDSIQDKVWALRPAKLGEITTFIERRLAGEKFEFPEAAIGKGGNRAQENYQVLNGVAVIPVYGTLDKRLNLFSQMSGGTSTELLLRDFNAALADPEVQAILLDVDSPGGAVDGTKKLADRILGARADKPVVAYANGLMASAAYWIGSAAQAIVAEDTALVGSIGVAMTHLDRSAQDEKLGIKRTAIFAGKYKRIASDEKPLSQEGQDYLQEIVDGFYEIFVDAVARNRGQDAETVQEKMADGREFIGKQALKAGLVDKLGNFDDALALAKSMASEPGQGGKVMDRKTLESQHPDLFVEVMALGQAEGKKAGLEEGASLERTRVIEILDADGDRAVTLEAIKSGATAADTFKLLYRAEKEKQGAALKALEEAAPASLGQVTAQPRPAAAADPDEELSAQAQARAREKGISLDAAMMEICRENPALVAKWNPAAELH